MIFPGGAEFCRAHVDDILARVPIRPVAMADWSGVNIVDRGLRTFRFRGCRNHPLADRVDPSRTDRGFNRRVRAEGWPGIAFELPSGHDDR